ncbi:hypothetical protein SAMN05720760_1131 [Fibrobacter sp. UWB8]|nr:hypothetical protein SAMN05720760_1131 [Fibrobacter sp. UWB8]
MGKLTIMGKLTVKLENLKAIHNYDVDRFDVYNVVIALVKLENLKAIHNCIPFICFAL